ncbi:Gamma-glutamylputrescine oxidoreductase [Ruegeria denitrificans]|uniref:Gamma-glutamylputrescine oxidoreductase n=1 Tax=Ruegeria denitrificans TaxID=1715692 RepID=A0A0P1I4T1_9RHOB|nr:Gamma-glutamylputrescine oxidoreductase [Ruegeria denitrificans]
MNLLYSNERKAEYPASWYAAKANPVDRFPALSGSETAEVCAVSAGYTDPSAALHLTEAGFSAVLLEAHRVGFGASGRNSCQLGSAQRMDQEDLERLVGDDDAAELWDLAEDA